MQDHIKEQIKHLIDMALETESVEEKDKLLARIKTIINNE